MNEAAARRKLATIVAVDAAGFSARAATDEAGAIEAVGALRRAVAHAADFHGGRVFNAAGDGFMLEFPTVSGAVDAALALAAGDPPARVGVHLGEVSEMPGGDLLGHGVNVAARLQQMAPPRGVLISSAVRQAVRGRQAAQFHARGEALLDKMNETVGVFVHAPRGARSRLRRRRSLLLAGAVAIAAVAAAAWFARPLIWPAPYHPLRVSVRPLQAVGKDPALAEFADEMTRTVRGDMVETKVQVLAPDARADRADLTISGIVHRGDDQALSVSLVAADRRNNATLWSAQFSAPPQRRADLREQAAAAAGLVVQCAAMAHQPGAGPIGAAALGTFLRACAAEEQNETFEDALALYREVTRAAPDFAPAWAARASLTAGQARFRGGPDPATLMAEARDSANRALRLNPREARAYLALAVISGPVASWAKRDRFIDRAYAIEPTDVDVAYARAWTYSGEGRVGEAVGAWRQATAAAPFAQIMAAQLANTLDSAGEHREARDLIEAAYRRWPGNTQVQAVRFWLAAWNDRTDDALAILDGPGADFVRAPAYRAAWQAVLKARASKSAADNAAARRLVLAGDAQGAIERFESIEMLAMLGDNDDAFRLTELASRVDPATPPIALFRTPSASLQADPRFLAAAGRYGLVSYWAKSGHWPDFCGRLDLPYDCRTEAAKLVAGRGPA